MNNQKRRRQKKFKHLTKTDRLEIAGLKKKGYSGRAIADMLGWDHTAINRELKRGKVWGRYDPTKAQHKSLVRRAASKYQGMKVRQRPELEIYVKAKLKKHWSPEEIAGRLKNIDTHLPYVSAPSIYQWCYSPYGQRWCKYLPKKRYGRKKRSAKKTTKTLIPNRKGLECRPQAANDRTEFGHFEEDTIASGKKHQVKAGAAALLERKARYLKLKKIRSFKTKIHNQAIILMSAEFQKLMTMTFDNGVENVHHEELQKELGIATFFCDPYSSWQKGSVENAIGLVRRFIPKGANFNDYSDRDLKRIESILNNTPKKCLGYKTPREVMIENNLLILKQKQHRSVVHLRV